MTHASGWERGPLTRFAIVECQGLNRGRAAICRGQLLVWTGSLCEPWEDAAGDTLLLAPEDYSITYGRRLPDGREVP